MSLTRPLAYGLAALLYLLLPTDLLPDFLPLVGHLDDLLALAAAAYFAWRGFKSATRHAPDAARPQPTQGAGPRDPYEVLGLKAGASPEDIRGAWRQRMAEYHPDKVAHLGPELRELALRKSLDIQRAYEALGKP